MEKETLYVLTGEQAAALSAVLNRLIPDNGVMTGAGDLGISSFIDQVLFRGPHLRQPLLRLLARVQDGCGQGGFSQLTTADKDSRLRGAEQEEKEAFDTLIRAAYIGYYSHPDVLHALGAEPTDHEASELTPFDPGWLEEVRRRGPIYMDI